MTDMENLKYNLTWGLVSQLEIDHAAATKMLDDFLESNGAPVAYFQVQKSGWLGKIVGKCEIENFRRDNTVTEINWVIYDHLMKNKELKDLGLL